MDLSDMITLADVAVQRLGAALHFLTLVSSSNDCDIDL